MTTQAPTLRTERLTLRAHRLEDFDDYLALWADPEVYRYISGEPMAPSDGWTRLLRYAGHWAMLGFGYWVITDRSSGQFVGDIGFADYHRDISPSLDGMPEAGWALASSHHGKGLASEALAAVIDWGDQHFGNRTTCCIIDPNNAPSIKLAQRFGYQFWVETQFAGTTSNLYRRAP